MEFGPWLRSVRQKSGLDLRDAGYLTEVDPSTINRIENQRTEATLGTAVNICRGLNIDLRDFIRAFFGEEGVAAIAQSPTDRTDAPVLTFADVNHIVDSLYRRPDLGLGVLADMITELTRIYADDSNKPGPPLFTPDDAIRLFVRSPLYEFNLNYPPDFGSEEIAATYNAGGTLTFTDVGAYIRGVRRAKRKTLAGLEETTRRSVSVLGRIEAGSLERIKLRDVLMLDQELGSNNEILRMFWRAAELSYEMVEAFDVGNITINNLEYVEALITVFRWVQAAGISATWLPRLRSLYLNR